MNTNRTTPKDFFVHLGATMALYVGAIALINLFLSIIDYSFPDTLAGYFSPSSIAWPVSMLVVLVPILYIFEWLTKKDMRIAPEKRDLWIRKWRIYMTLFLTGATIVGDLIVLINTYINGEVTGRFVYKTIAVLVVAGVIFAYYILDRIQQETSSSKIWKTILSYAGIVVVLVGIVGGFVIVGSPANQRALRLDNQRIQDLTTIQWQIVSYWQHKSNLPKALPDLNDTISGFVVPSDPATDKAYEYSASTSLSFELCATFDRASQNLKGRGAYVGYGGGYSIGATVPISAPYMYGITDSSNVWQHRAGRTCFVRTIDTQRYAPLKTVPASAI